jgi:hypothetical protein
MGCWNVPAAARPADARPSVALRATGRGGPRPYTGAAWVQVSMTTHLAVIDSQVSKASVPVLITTGSYVHGSL